MAFIVPAILPKSKEDLAEKLARFAAIPSVDTVQIDAIDGHFASPASWPYTTGTGIKEMTNAGEQLPELGRLTFDIDLMLADPAEAVADWVMLGASRFTLHAESVSNLERLVAYIRQRYGHAKDFIPNLFSFGLALNIGSDLALIEPFIDHVDYVQCMGIAHIGKQGEPFDKRVLSKVRELRKRHPKLTIQVDGGVSLATAPELLAAGADRLIVGSTLMNASDPAAEIEKFEQLGQQYGAYQQV